MLAIDILRWPGMNQAFIASIILTAVLAYGVIWVGKRRSVDRTATWGEAMFGSVYVFGVMFVAFGVIPHQFIEHADKNLGWRKDKLLFGPFDVLKPKSFGGPFPFTLSYEAIRDTIVLVIHVVLVTVMVLMFNWWQKRGEVKPKAIATSTYGRPLVRKG